MLQEIFPKIYRWDWDRHLAEIAAQMVIELAVFRRDEDDGLTANEARRCLRKMSDANRGDAIRRLGKIGKREESGWADHVVPFLDLVWPKERKYRTTASVRAWINLLEDTGKDFPAVLKSVKRFLVPVQQESHSLYRFTREVGGKAVISSEHPSATLEMLNALVADDPFSVPVELPEILEMIVAAEPSLQKDHRYFRLIDLSENR